ncbi:hypothetical protein O7598_02790 [Micromonospora sp. WMMC241]|uniref:hypothetical protein n=1 Tax=Micromonospora sp. WMMC241 TaxID=3015159 RepID=UPI0022B64E9C|nr:hypothetical protein [Micromonospora sp. WMMC241]MCZ7435310.1 hypothetical protein [Micromonospora sp. WMMC241]
MTPEQRLDTPFLVALSWAIVDYHLAYTCSRCRPYGWCPRVVVARARIRAWGRVREQWRS